METDAPLSWQVGLPSSFENQDVSGRCLDAVEIRVRLLEAV